jgi:hypothetical protein
MSPLSIFDYIREINKLSSKELSLGQFKLLIEIALRAGTTGKTWPNNSDLSIATALKKNSIKVLLSNLKKKKLIFINKEDGKKIIRLGHPTERKELMMVNQRLRLMTINQKHPTKQKGLTTINQRLMTINQRLTTVNPLIKKEKKEKKEKLGATPDSFNFWHPYIDEIMAAIPKEAKGKIPRAFVNEHLKKKGGDRPYFYWVFDHAADKPDPVKWITMGIRGYYGAYLKSDEYESGETITEITNLETL